MPKDNLPAYAIVELLIRLEKHDTAIGDYKNHAESANGVMVKTTRGSISFPQSLIMQQFEKPKLISDDELAAKVSLFRSVN